MISNKELQEQINEELQERRQSDIIPCDKYLKNNIFKQMDHIEEEFDEVSGASMDYIIYEDEKNKSHLVEELIDLQTSCETMLAILLPDKSDRILARKQVIEKNRVRGYYDK